MNKWNQELFIQIVVPRHCISWMWLIYDILKKWGILLYTIWLCRCNNFITDKRTQGLYTFEKTIAEYNFQTLLFKISAKFTAVMFRDRKTKFSSNLWFSGPKNDTTKKGFLNVKYFFHFKHYFLNTCTCIKGSLNNSLYL